MLALCVRVWFVFEQVQWGGAGLQRGPRSGHHLRQSLRQTSHGQSRSRQDQRGQRRSVIHRLAHFHSLVHVSEELTCDCVCLQILSSFWSWSRETNRPWVRSRNSQWYVWPWVYGHAFMLLLCVRSHDDLGTKIWLQFSDKKYCDLVFFKCLFVDRTIWPKYCHYIYQYGNTIIIIK